MWFLSLGVYIIAKVAAHFWGTWGGTCPFLCVFLACKTPEILNLSVWLERKIVEKKLHHVVSCYGLCVPHLPMLPWHYPYLCWERADVSPLGLVNCVGSLIAELKPYSETITNGDIAITLAMHTDWLIEERWAIDSLQNSYCKGTLMIVFPMNSLDYKLQGKPFFPFTVIPCLSFPPSSLYRRQCTMTFEISAALLGKPWELLGHIHRNGEEWTLSKQEQQSENKRFCV